MATMQELGFRREKHYACRYPGGVDRATGKVINDYFCEQYAPDEKLARLALKEKYPHSIAAQWQIVEVPHV